MTNPGPQSHSAMSNDELINAYLAGIDSVRQAAQGLDAGALRARPGGAAGAWNALEVICHLADSEALFAERMKRVLTEERPSFAFSDPARAVAALAYDRREADEELDCLAATRRQMARILRAQPSEAWGRIGLHSRQGEQTLEQLLQKAVDHLDHHVRFLHEKRRALGGSADV